MKSLILKVFILGALILFQVQSTQAQWADMSVDVHTINDYGRIELGDTAHVVVYPQNIANSPYPAESVQIYIDAPYSGQWIGIIDSPVSNPDWVVDSIVGNGGGNRIYLSNANGPMTIFYSVNVYLGLKGVQVTQPVNVQYWAFIHGVTPDATTAGNLNSGNDDAASGFEVIPASTPTSLDFLSISATWRDNMPLISWVVENERNTISFEVQRSFDASNFNTVGTVASIGDHVEAHTYMYSDKDIFENSSSKVYYRIKEQDSEGNTSYSTVVLLNPQSDFKDINVNIYPNPVIDILKVSLDASQENEAKVQIVSNNGQVLRQQSVEISKGKSSISIEVEDFAPGVYYLYILTENTDKLGSFKFTKK